MNKKKLKEHETTVEKVKELFIKRRGLINNINILNGKLPRPKKNIFDYLGLYCLNGVAILIILYLLVDAIFTIFPVENFWTLLGDIFMIIIALVVILIVIGVIYLGLMFILNKLSALVNKNYKYTKEELKKLATLTAEINKEYTKIEMVNKNFNTIGIPPKYTDLKYTNSLYEIIGMMIEYQYSAEKASEEYTKIVLDEERHRELVRTINKYAGELNYEISHLKFQNKQLNRKVNFLNATKRNW